MMRKLKDVYLKFLNINGDNEIESLVKSYLRDDVDELSRSKYSSFLKELGIKAEKEIKENKDLEKRINNVESDKQLKELIFKENALEVTQESIENIRRNRSVDILENVQEIKSPIIEILFTSNVMLTFPKNKYNIDKKYRNKIDFSEKQKYWFDHPIPLDIKDESNEILYGLKNLNEAIKYEAQENEKAKIVLSVSCTHETLKNIAKDYLMEKLEQVELDYLDIYIFTENECEVLLDMLYKDKLGEAELIRMKEIIGVDGKYGRHYSFLKGIAPFFSKFIDSRIKLTFKIDLDQVFDQKKIKAYTGSYALEKFKNKKLGATAVDSQGKKVRLGMIAGYLINDVDIHKSMYEPDVPVPNSSLTTEQYIFNSSRPQYISTVAEMLNEEEKEDKASLRYHITGGMNGVLVEDLIKYKPFTPSFITRAEDQAFMLEIINKPVDNTYLRCYHQKGLFMRHDKGTFLQEDLKKFEMPKKVGDFERILLFSHYAKDILCDYEGIKKEIAPFTASFITNIPFTVVLFRIIFAAYDLSKANIEDAKLFLDQAMYRIPEIIQNIEKGTYVEIYKNEKRCWETYYNSLNENKISEKHLREFEQIIKY